MLRSTLFLALLTSCTENEIKDIPDGKESHEVYNQETGLTERTEYYSNGNIRIKGYFKGDEKEGEFRQYDENGILEAVANYKKDNLNGTFKVFYPSGNLKQKVYYSNGKPIGWSYEFWENGKKRIARQFIDIIGDGRRNQIIEYDSAGMIIRDNSHYMTITSTNDTIALGDKITFYFKLEAPFFGSESQLRLLIGGFDNQYRLVDSTKVDTVMSQNLTAKYTVRPKKRGKYYVRGRLDDYKVEEISNGRFPYEKQEVHIYFTKEYYVK